MLGHSPTDPVSFAVRRAARNGGTPPAPALSRTFAIAALIELSVLCL